jgi:molybdopterin synthase catalytic subunit
VALAEQAVAEHGALRVAVVHRVGRLELGDAAVAIAVSAAHRAEAFEACRWVIDTLKRCVPIWKQEHFTDGSTWIAEHP